MDKIINLDFDKYTSSRQVHDYLHWELDLPDHYGNNLDALYDCLTDIDETVYIFIHNYDILDHYQNDLVSAMEDAEKDNPKVRIRIVEEEQDR